MKSPTLPFLVTIFLFLLFTSCHTESDSEYSKINIGDIELHYQIHGIGTPLILIHGSLADLRYWKEQTAFLKDHFQVITYSRRYNYPNNNQVQNNHSVTVEAADLLALMDELDIDRAYIVGHSYGAYTALWFALEHSKRVSKLVLAEPPLIKWLSDIPGGEGLEEIYMANTWRPIARSFREGGVREGLELTSKWNFHSPMDSMPGEWQNSYTDNAREWNALTNSNDPFPMVDYRKVKNLNIPVLLLSGSTNSRNMEDLIDGHLAQLLPNNRRVTLKNSGYPMFLDNPNLSNKAIFNFLRQ